MTVVALLLGATLLAGGGPAADPAARLAAANALLAAGDAEGAARGYEALLADGLESAALHANLGAAHLRAGRRGAAVASYLRALRLEPGDADTRADLALARGGRADAASRAAERPFLARVVERTPDGAAAAAFALPWAALFALLAGRRSARGGARGALLAAAAVAALLAAGGLALLLARAAARRADVAVVTAGEAAVRGAPERALRPLLVVEEGSEVRVLDVRGDFARVGLEGGVEGWMALADLERL